MAPEKVIKLRFGELAVFEKSFRIDGCAETAYLGSEFEVKNLDPEFIPTLKKFLEVAYRKGQMREAEIRAHLTATLLSAKPLED